MWGRKCGGLLPETSLICWNRLELKLPSICWIRFLLNEPNSNWNNPKVPIRFQPLFVTGYHPTENRENFLVTNGLSFSSPLPPESQQNCQKTSLKKKAHPRPRKKNQLEINPKMRGCHAVQIQMIRVRVARSGSHTKLEQRNNIRTKRKRPSEWVNKKTFVFVPFHSIHCLTGVPSPM